MIYIFGGISLDFIFTKENFIKGTSNPSDFTYRIGGVGYNIFKFLQIKGKIFITTVGNDPFGKIILESSDIKNINKIFIEDYSNDYNKGYTNNYTNYYNNSYSNDYNNAYFNDYNNNYANAIKINQMENLNLSNLPAIIFMIAKEFPTSIYNVLMQKGSCYIATADFRIIEKNLIFSKISFILKNINENDLAILDSNIQKDELEKIINNLSERKIKIFFETISLEKTKRAKDIIKNIYFTSPDTLEFNELLEGYESIFDYMEKQNIEYILRTDGADGSTLFKKKEKSYLIYKPKRVLNVKDTTGAGDFLFSKIVQLFSEGFSIEKSVEIATDEVLIYLEELNNI